MIASTDEALVVHTADPPAVFDDAATAMAADSPAPRARAELELELESTALPLTYADRMKQEVDRFSVELDINNLPPIFHYWSHTYLRPELERFGYRNPEHFFEVEMAKLLASSDGRVCHFASLGSGNGDVEVQIAQALVAKGWRNFRIDCLELTAEMNERTAQLAASAGVAEHVDAVSVDLNNWRPSQRYAAIMANQSLHHMVELELILDAVKIALADDGCLLISDMIGRNGHQRWPEALAIVREFWRELPEHYRYNLQLKRAESEFMDWDCSSQGFEGIRAQDILPLLCERFAFELFLPFANVIDPFVDRSFGHHFNADAAWDRDFIDRVHARDAAELARGQVKPTHLIAVLTRSTGAVPRWRSGFSPEACIRRPEPVSPKSEPAPAVTD